MRHRSAPSKVGPDIEQGDSPIARSVRPFLCSAIWEVNEGDGSLDLEAFLLKRGDRLVQGRSGTQGIIDNHDGAATVDGSVDTSVGRIRLAFPECSGRCTGRHFRECRRKATAGRYSRSWRAVSSRTSQVPQASAAQPDAVLFPSVRCSSCRTPTARFLRSGG